MRRSGSGLVDFMLVVAMVAVICGVLYGLLAPFTTRSDVLATVTDKERVTSSDGKTVDSKYLIFTDKEVFEDTDSFILFKFNSSDIYGKIMKDRTYKFKVYGFRVPFFSWYRNVISADPQ